MYERLLDDPYAVERPADDSFWPEPPDCPCCVDPRPLSDGSPDLVQPTCWSIPGVTGLTRLEPIDALPLVSPLVVRLREDVTRLCHTQPASLPAGQALADAEALLQITQQLRIHNLLRIADVETRKLHQLTGIRSTSSWIRHVEPDTADGDPALGKQLRRYGHLREQLAGRRVSLTAARQVSRCLERLRPHLDRTHGLIDDQPAEQVIPAVVRNVVEQIAQQQLGLRDDDPLLQSLIAQTDAIAEAGSTDLLQLEQAFTLLSQHVPVSALPALLDQALCAVLPSTLDQRADRAEQRAAFHLERRLDGGWHVEGDLTDTCGELLHLALNAEVRRDPQNPLDTAAAAALREDGLDPYDPVDTHDLADTTARPDATRSAGKPPQGWGPARAEPPDQNSWDGLDPWHPDWNGTVPRRPARFKPRSRARRLHDAMHRLLERYLAADLAGSHDKRPVAMTVTVPSTLLDDAPGAPPAKTGAGQLLSRRTLKQWWCNATLTPYLLSRGWIALGRQHTQRTLTAPERTALDLQSGGNRCAGVGCCRGHERPVTGLEPHHLHPWAATGTTSLAETIWACPALHHDLHHGKTVLLRNSRRLDADGWAD